LDTFTCFGIVFSHFHGLSVLKGGTAVAQWLRCCATNCRWFDSRWCHWNFSLTYSFQSHYGPGVDPASNRNEYQENFLGLNAAGA